MNTENTEKWIKELGSDDPAIRQRAREQLVALGDPDVTRALVGELVDPRKQVRWEAAKALIEIADPVSAPALMNALDDEDSDVRWMAGKGLIAMGRPGLLTVLSGVMKRARSLDFCKSAHHVLHDLKQDDIAETIAPVLEALDSTEPAVTAPPAALSALMALKNAGD